MAWLVNNFGLVLGLTLEHARLSAIPIVVGFIASIPLGWLASRYRIAKAILLSAGSIAFTIPSSAHVTQQPAARAIALATIGFCSAVKRPRT